MQRLINRLNRSQALGRLINFFSTRLAHYRGVPILVGLILTVISFITHLIAAMTGSTAWQVVASTLLHAAIFVGLLGILLAEPLGKG